MNAIKTVNGSDKKKPTRSRLFRAAYAAVKFLRRKDEMTFLSCLFGRGRSVRVRQGLRNY